jgi:hypothetical protein
MGPTAPLSATVLVQTVDENKGNFTPEDVKKADLAKRSPCDFYNMIKFNMISGCPVTIHDVKLAQTIYGKDIYSIRSKTVRRKPSSVQDDIIMPVPPSILTHYRKITLCVDLFFINKIPFFCTISRKILFMTVQPLKNRKLATIYDAISKSITIYRARGFRVHFVFADNEFRGLREQLLQLKVYLNCAAAMEHVPEVERAIHVIKEHTCVALDSLPFSIIPTRFLKELVGYMVSCINMFPRRGGVSNNLSPRTLICGVSLDYKTQCQVPFGAYCEIHDDNVPTNTMQARTTPAISLGPTGNL